MMVTTELDTFRAVFSNGIIIFKISYNCNESYPFQTDFSLDKIEFRPEKI